MQKRERILIVGARGQLGRALREAFAGVDVIAPERAELEVTSAESIRATFERHRPALVINTSAFHVVDDCEADPASAFEINALSVDRLAGESARIGAAFAHVSTDYVFDGSKGAPYDEQDAPNPINVYGASKLAGELLLRRHGSRNFIFRTSGLYGPDGVSRKGPTFVERMLLSAERGEPLRVVGDIVFAPSYAPHVADALRAVTATDRYGLYHVTNAGYCSWFELAAETVRAAGYDVPVERISATQGSGARRPPFSALAHGALIRAGFEELPNWREGVRAFIGARRVRKDAASAASM